MRGSYLALVFCFVFLQNVYLGQTKCVVLTGSDECTGEEFSYTTTSTVTYSSGTHSESSVHSSESSSHVSRHESSSEGEPMEEYGYYNATSDTSSSTSQTTATNATRVETKSTFESATVGEADDGDADGCEVSISPEESMSAVEAWAFYEMGSFGEAVGIAPELEPSLDLLPVEDPVPYVSTFRPAVVSTPEPSLTVPVEPETPAPPMEPTPKPEVPLVYYPCGYAKPVEQHNLEDASPHQTSYYSIPTEAPCPLAKPPAQPSPLLAAPPPPPVQPVSPPPPPVQPVTPPPPPVQPVTPPPPPPVQQASAVRVPSLPNVTSTPSHVLAREVKATINSGNFTALSELVIESDDIYGLNMGLRFTDEERETELLKTAERETDKDVIVFKALALAALNPGTKGKVVQLMVVTATAPDGYSFDQHRSLAKRFEEVFSQETLLRTIVAANPQEYLRRRLLCAGCIPTNSYICAHCWPNAVCSTYFWCADAAVSSKEASAESIEEGAKSKDEKNKDAVTSDGAHAFASEAAIEEPSRRDHTTAEQPEKSKSQRRRVRRRRRRHEKREAQNSGSKNPAQPNKAPSRDP